MPSLCDALAAGGSVAGLALVSALWCRYCAGVTEGGAVIAANDPAWDMLQGLSQRAKSDPQVWLGMQAVYGDLGSNPVFATAFAAMLRLIWDQGTEAALKAYLAG